jgi:hypothetical protein
MADRPILFSAPMVRALLDGRKTQTRRSLGQYDVLRDFEGKELGISWVHVEGEYLPRVTIGNVITARKLKAAVGDRLWVREAWRTQECFDDESPAAIVDQFREEWSESSIPAFYEADQKFDDHSIEIWQQSQLGRLRASMHMPRCASRLTLTVTDVRVQRLQDITEQDAIAEGVERADDFFGCPCWKCYGKFSDVVSADDPIVSYESLWNHINGSHAWDKNPWVAAYTFTVSTRNIDEVQP